MQLDDRPGAPCDASEARGEFETAGTAANDDHMVPAPCRTLNPPSQTVHGVSQWWKESELALAQVFEVHVVVEAMHRTLPAVA
jgi:hypothetical protein